MSSPNLSNLPLSMEEKTLPDALDTPVKVMLWYCFLALPNLNLKLTENRGVGGVFLNSLRKGESSEKSTRAKTNRACTDIEGPAQEREVCRETQMGREVALDAKARSLFHSCLRKRK